jgi:hypothetical protein
MQRGTNRNNRGPPQPNPYVIPYPVRILLGQDVVTPGEEREAIKGILADDKMVYDAKYYLVSLRWWQLWKQWVQYDEKDPARYVDGGFGQRPGAIDNTELLATEEELRKEAEAKQQQQQQAQEGAEGAGAGAGATAGAAVGSAAVVDTNGKGKESSPSAAAVKETEKEKEKGTEQGIGKGKGKVEKMDTEKGKEKGKGKKKGDSSEDEDSGEDGEDDDDDDDDDEDEEDPGREVPEEEGGILKRALIKDVDYVLFPYVAWRLIKKWCVAWL